MIAEPEDRGFIHAWEFAREVLLPDGRYAVETREVTPSGLGYYTYAWAGDPLDVSDLPRGPEGRILDTKDLRDD